MLPDNQPPAHHATSRAGTGTSSRRRLFGKWVGMCRICAFVWGNPGDIPWRTFQLPRYNLPGYEWLKLHEADHGCIPNSYPEQKNKKTEGRCWNTVGSTAVPG